MMYMIPLGSKEFDVSFGNRSKACEDLAAIVSIVEANRRVFLHGSSGKGNKENWAASGLSKVSHKLREALGRFHSLPLRPPECLKSTAKKFRVIRDDHISPQKISKLLIVSLCISIQRQIVFDHGVVRRIQ